MPKCVYCGKEYEIPRGLTLVGKDGSINYLCSSKCRKNRAMKRRKVRWISKPIRDKSSKKSPKVEEKREEPKKEEENLKK